MVSNIICDCLKYAKESPATLVSALRVIEREQLIDQEMERRKTYSGVVLKSLSYILDDIRVS